MNDWSLTLVRYRKLIIGAMSRFVGHPRRSNRKQSLQIVSKI